MSGQGTLWTQEYRAKILSPVGSGCSRAPHAPQRCGRSLSCRIMEREGQQRTWDSPISLPALFICGSLGLGSPASREGPGLPRLMLQEGKGRSSLVLSARKWTDLVVNELQTCHQLEEQPMLPAQPLSPGAEAWGCGVREIFLLPFS